MKEKGKDVRVILHNIRSTHNVGSIFRTADGAGVSRIYLAGYTPAPIDRFGRAQPDIAKTALGAEKTVPWEVHADVLQLIRVLRAEGVRIVAVEQYPNAVDYATFVPGSPVVFIFGNEVEGVPTNICEAADAVIEIPMQGSKESLNVSVAAGVVLFRF